MPNAAPSLARRGALHETDAGQDAHAEGDAVVVRLLPPCARFSLRINASRLSRADGLAGFADLAINRCRVVDGRAAMRLGPDEWLLSGPVGEAERIAADFAAVLGGLHHALVDVGHGRVALSVSGPRAAEAINSGCALDLSVAAFPAGTATRTLLGKAEIVLARWDEAPAFEIECARSLSAYVREFLTAAARQYRAEG
jgi:sarcosine oxidase subunit gamma